VPEAAKRVGQGGADVLVRVNRPWRLAVRDLEAAVGQDVRGLVLPKVDSAEHLLALAEITASVEEERGLPVGHTVFFARIEGPKGLLNAAEICAAHPRVVAVGLGSSDYTIVTGMEAGGPGNAIASFVVVNAARAAGVVPIGLTGAVVGFADLDAFRRSAEESRALGLRGAPCVHPSQVPVLNEFSASPTRSSSTRGAPSPAPWWGSDTSRSHSEPRMRSRGSPRARGTTSTSASSPRGSPSVSSFGPLLVGLVLGAGAAPSAASTTRVMLIAAGIAALATACAAVADRGRSSVGFRAKARRGSVRAIVSTRGVPAGIFASIAVLSAADVFTAYLPVIGESRDIGPRAIGGLLALRAVASIAARVGIGGFVQRVGRRRLISIGATAAAIALMAMTVTDDVWALAALCVVMGFGLSFGQPLSMTLVVQLVPEHARSTALAVRLTGNRIGQVATPAAAGLLPEARA